MRTAVALICLTCVLSSPSLRAQQAVDARHRYERAWCVLSVTGKGTFDDPKRPLFAPVKPDAINRQTGLIGMSWVLSDDGQFALVEFVARNRSAFSSVQAGAPR